MFKLPDIPQGATKEQAYKEIIPQITALISSETDRTAALGNVAAMLHGCMGFFWTGFYLVKNGELVLNAFQGPVACSRIKYGRGVCGTAWAQRQAIVVEDVDKFPGHIACSSLSRSEIVVPLLRNGEAVGVLDIDSDRLSAFDDTDKEMLLGLCRTITEICFQNYE